MAARRFPPPWSVEEQAACFVVRERNGRFLFGTGSNAPDLPRDQKITVASSAFNTGSRFEGLRWRGDAAQIGGDGRILSGKQVDVAEFDVDRHDARPFSAGAEKPFSIPDQPRCVKSIAGN